MLLQLTEISPWLHFILYGFLSLLLVVILQLLNTFVCDFGFEVRIGWPYFAAHQFHYPFIVMQPPNSEPELNRLTLRTYQFSETINELLGGALPEQIPIAIPKRMMLIEQYIIDISDLLGNLSFSLGECE